MDNFSDWIIAELDRRGWKQIDLAKAAHLDRAVISNLVNGRRGPGEDTCTAIAHALGYPPLVVFRAAGLLPPDPEMTPDIAAVIQAMSGLPESWQAKVAEDTRKLREFYERTEADRLEKARLAARKGTGPLPDLP